MLLGRIVAVEKTVDEGRGLPAAVRHRGDGGAHEPLGVLLGRLAGRLHRLGSVALVQGHEALRPDPRSGNLGLHVADHEIGGPDVAAQQVPHRLDLATGLVHLD